MKTRALIALSCWCSLLSPALATAAEGEGGPQVQPGNPAEQGGASMAPEGEAPEGEAPEGEAPVGEAPVGEASVGEASVGEASVGEASVGEASVGEASEDGAERASPDVAGRDATQPDSADGAQGDAREAGAASDDAQLHDALGASAQESSAQESSAQESSAQEPSAQEPSAQEPSPELSLEGPLEGASTVSRAESASYGIAEKGHARLILPSQWVEVGGEMAFITSEPALTEQATRFSDLGLLRLRARRSFGECLELSLHAQLLAKQPSTTDEPIWQAAGLGARVEPVERLAFGLSGSAGRLLNDDGYFWRAAPGAQYKPEISRYLRFLLGAGGTLTALHFAEPAEQAFWLAEVTADAEVQAGDRNAVMWVGLNYALPVASHPGSRDADPLYGALDPQVRLGLNVGGALTLDSEDWDVYALYSVVDRGELTAPGTTLPILDGGFDQQQITVGVQHRFGPDAEKRRTQYW